MTSLQSFNCTKALSWQSLSENKSVACLLYVRSAARLPQHDKTRVAKQHRRKELENRQKIYRLNTNRDF